MSKFKNQSSKIGRDARGGFKCAFMAPVGVFHSTTTIPAHQLVSVEFASSKKINVTRAMERASQKAIRAVLASKVRRERRVMIERFGRISVHTEIVDTPVGQRVMSALDSEGAWHGRPEDLSDEDIASFGLEG